MEIMVKEIKQKKIKKLYTENDRAWKELTTSNLHDFTKFFHPQAYQEIDWTRPIEFLEQELTSVETQAAEGTKHIDKLFKVFLLTGEEQWVLLHIEFQHSKEDDFPERMFR